MASPRIAAAPREAQPQREEPAREEIERLAYCYWERRGCPDDGGEEDWLRAEDDLRNGRFRTDGTS
ncbi:MAG TPA: DUF2934 domain-containing protein [Bryobacteraceae bacterium]|nr:DUF2934 domain-containing protein [Bryobacteraceae bacterium]